jgi:hypothetical protein
MAAGPGSDSIDFYAKCGSWSDASSMTCSASTPNAEISSFLAEVREEVSRKAFEILGIDTGRLEKYAETLSSPLKGGSYEALPKIYKALGSKESEDAINAASKNAEELKPFAKAYLLREAATNAGISWYIGRRSGVFGNAAPKNTWKIKNPLTAEGISFMAKYGDWIAVKKLSITPNTKPEEIAAHLSSIRIAADRKIAQVLGVDTDSLDAYASASTDRMRKSAANIEKIVSIMCTEETKKQIDSSISNGAPRSAAVVYLFGKMLQNIKLDLEVSPDTLMDMFPGLKIPKPKGRMPGQKKKKQ